jgi:hypothetical protein
MSAPAFTLAARLAFAGLAATVTMLGCDAAPAPVVAVEVAPILPPAIASACFEVRTRIDGEVVRQDVCGAPAPALRVASACDGDAVAAIEVVASKLYGADGEDLTHRLQSPCTAEAPCVATTSCGAEPVRFDLLFIPKIASGSVDIGLEAALPREATHACVNVKVLGPNGRETFTTERCTESATLAATWVAPCSADGDARNELVVTLTSLEGAQGAIDAGVLPCGDGRQCSRTFTCLADRDTSIDL